MFTPKEDFDFSLIKTGSIVFGKDAELVFYNKTDLEKVQQELEPGHKLEWKHYRRLPTINLDGKFALLTAASHTDKPKNFMNKEWVERYYDIEVLYEEQLYKAFEVDAYKIAKKLDFLSLPPRPNIDSMDTWLSDYYGTNFGVFRANKSFRARRGDSVEQLARWKRIPRRDDACKTFYVNRGELCVLVGARRTAGRRLIIVDFFINSVLCWLELEETFRKKDKKFGQFFYSLGAGKTPYEKDIDRQGVSDY